MDTKQLTEFRHWMDNLRWESFPEELDNSAWSLMYDYGYPFEEWFAYGMSGEEIADIVLLDFNSKPESID